MRIRGISVEAHWSVIVPFIWLPLRLAPAYRDRLPDLSTSTVTAMALGSVALFQASIVLHEFGHSLQARREGMAVERVILYALGGVAFISGLGRWKPGADVRITAAGPLVSLALACIFGPLALLASGAGWPDWVLGLLAFLAWANAVLLVFNLLPVFPLDGGRLLHATLWRVRGYEAAAAWTTRVSLAVAGAVLAAGVVLGFVLAQPASLAGTPGLTGFPIMFAGALLLTAAYAIRPPSRMPWPTTLRARQVGDLLAPQPVLPAPDTSVAAFLDGITRAGGQGAAAYPVIEDGKVLGVISPAVAADALAEGRTVAEAMVRKEHAVMLMPDMPIEEAYAALGEDPSARGVVLAGARVLGILRPSDLADALLEAREAAPGTVVPATPPKMSVDW